jgi:hypothetical protein
VNERKEKRRNGKYVMRNEQKSWGDIIFMTHPHTGTPSHDRYLILTKEQVSKDKHKERGGGHTVWIGQLRAHQSLTVTVHAALLGMISKSPTGKATTLCEVQVGIGRGEAQETIECLARDNNATSGAEETRLLEEGDSVILMRGHDWE